MSIVRVLIGFVLGLAAAAAVAQLPGLNNVVVLVGVFVAIATLVPVAGALANHPRGLYILFFAEMWERFSYYGMRGLLIFYLTQQFLFDDHFSQGQYGSYTSLVYLLPLVGGFIADKWLGTRKAIAFGALLLVAGHFTMGIEGAPAKQILTYQEKTYEFQTTGRMEQRQVCLKVDTGCYEVGPGDGGGLAIKGIPEGASLPALLAKDSYKLTVAERNPLFVNIFYLALSLIIMGVGFLKANISSIVGQLYPEGDPRRDPGFTLYYYGINLGAFLASIFCGYLGTNFGWRYGFGLAGVGMLVGFLVFVMGKPLLEGKGEPPNPDALKKSVLGPINLEGFIYLGGLAGLAVVFFVVQRNEWVGYLLMSGSGLVLAYLLFFMLTRCTAVEMGRLVLALILIFGSVVFFTLFEQAGSSLNQFAERNTNLVISPTPTIQLLGFTIDMNFTAAQAQAFNAGFILLLAPLFSALWAWLGTHNRDPDPVFKFGIGLVQVGLGFFLLVWGSQFHDSAFKVPLLFLAGAYLLHTTAELCLSPVGLSQMTKLAPTAVLATVMATWFLASSWAQFLGGFIAQLTASETVAGQVLDPAKALETYGHVFSLIGSWGVYIGLGFIVLSPILKRLRGGVR
ncbi:MAG: oligopeptide:H+ symporter [Alphaproteobacteria bacterium]